MAINDKKKFMECEREFVESEMKPCPFCGKTESVGIRTSDDLEDDGITDQFLVCCRFRLGGCGASSGYARSKEEAITLWNQRA